MMVLKEFFHQFLPAIEQGIKTTISNDIPPDFPLLHEMMNYHFGFEPTQNSQKSQGKQIRPVMLLLSTIVCGGDWKEALPGAIAIELIHNFSLIHDDIEDQSELRRGRKTLWKVYGIPQAINTGDAMFALAQLNLLQLGDNISSQVGLKATKKLNETCLILTGGQSLDISFEQELNVPMNQYVTMISGKTAALLSASAEIGAIVAQSENRNIISLANFGKSLGLAFQAWDDWLGLWGNEDQTGKSTLSDLITGKKTLPILYGLENGREFADVYHKNGVNRENAPILLKLLEKEGAKEFIEKIAKNFTEEALASLNEVKVENQQGLDALVELTDLLVNRNN